MAAQLGSPACGGHTGSTGTHDDHVKVLGLVRGDVAQLAHGGLHFLHAQAVGDNGLGLVGFGGSNGHTLGLIDAALGSLPDGVGGDGCAGVAVHLAGLCVQNLLDHLIGDVGTVALGLVCNVDLHIGDGVGAEGHGHGDGGGGVDAGSGGAVGACSVGACGCACGGAAGSAAVAAACQQTGSCCAQRSGAQEVAARDLFAHSVFLLLFLFLLDRVLCRSSKAKRQTLLLDKQSLHVRAARRSRVILTKISRVFVRGDKSISGKGAVWNRLARSGLRAQPTLRNA